MQSSPDGVEEKHLTQCVALCARGAASQPLVAWARSRQWQCHVEPDPFRAWAHVLLIEKSKAERARWGLQPQGRTILLIDDRACDAATLSNLSSAFDRYAPAATRITLHDGALPNRTDTDQDWTAVETAPQAEPLHGTASPDASVPIADEEPHDPEDDRLTPDEIRMLLGDDPLETIS